MAECQQKRFREGEEATQEGESETKRHCSFHHILSLLESDEEEPTQDPSSLITTLQQELSSSEPLSEPSHPDPASSPAPPSALFKEGDEEEEEEVMRQLLEASDDHLGIPQTEIEGGFLDTGEVREVTTYDGIWELEDEAANYYTLLQSELFM